MQTNQPPQPTFGEKLVTRLLTGLSPTEYYWEKEVLILTDGRSARQNPDFVILGAHLGVIVLEVKDWVEILEADQESITIRRRDGTITNRENPLVTARKYAINLAKRFETREELLTMHDGRKKLAFPWIPAVALPHIDQKIVDQIGKAGIWERRAILSKDVLTPVHFEAALQNLPSPFPLNSPLTNNIRDVIKGVLKPERIILKDGKDVGTLTPNQEREIYRPLPIKPRIQQLALTDELPEIVKDSVENVSIRLIRGVAGSGKSLILARRAQYIAEEYPEAKLLVWAFNVDLIDDLRRRMPDSLKDSVTNFHKLCSRVLGREWHSPSSTEGWLKRYCENELSQLQLPARFVADEIAYRKDLEIYDGSVYLEVERLGRGLALSRAKREIINAIFDKYLQFQHQNRVLDWEDVPRLTLARLQPGHPEWHAYDVILIDEAQDFAPTWFNVAKALLKPTGELFLCDDPTQSLFKYFSWRQKGVDVVGKTRILRIPFRCTRQITTAAHSLIQADAVLSKADDITQPDMKAYELLSGDPPFLYFCQTPEAEVRFVQAFAKHLVSKGESASNIAILCHNNRLLETFESLTPDGYYVRSFGKMKGLEFPVVFIPSIDTLLKNVVSDLGEAEITRVRRQVFTAMTRARQTLIMTCVGSVPELLQPILPHVTQEAAW